MRSLDVVRGLYARSPVWLRSGVGWAVGLLPTSLQYGGSYRRTRRLIERGERDPEFVRDYVVQRLRALLALAYQRSSYYREAIDRALGPGCNPAALTLAEFERLPILTKGTVRAQLDRLLIRPAWQLDFGTTSGSSGRPLGVYLDKDRGTREIAFVHHIWGKAGYRPGDRRAVLRGVQLGDADRRPWRYDPALRELLLSPFHLLPEVMDRYLELIDRYRVRFIQGYPSALTILAKHALRRGWRPAVAIAGVFPISESLLAFQRRLIEQAFGAPRILPFYGMSEKVAIAGEVEGCPDLYEFEPLYGYVELVDARDRPITEIGRTGRIVGTGFISTGCPLIRYDTGDNGELAALPDASNGYRLRVRNIRSRWSQEYLVARNGALISMAAINIHSAAYAQMRAFQFYQDTPGKVVVKVVPLPGKGEREVEPFVREIQRKVGAGIEFRLMVCQELYRNPRGKQPFIEQRLDLGRYGGEAA